MIEAIVFASLLFLSLAFSLGTVIYIHRLDMKDRDRLYRLIKADNLTDYTSNKEDSTPPKGRSTILENMRRGMGIGEDE